MSEISIEKEQLEVEREVLIDSINFLNDTLATWSAAIQQQPFKNTCKDQGYTINVFSPVQRLIYEQLIFENRNDNQIVMFVQEVTIPIPGRSVALELFKRFNEHHTDLAAQFAAHRRKCSDLKRRKRIAESELKRIDKRLAEIESELAAF